jgi:8-oxo-dGTP pyrophosphatase MutT (NUDIX family)
LSDPAISDRLAGRVAHQPRGGPQRIPRPEGVRAGPGAWWSRPGAEPPAFLGLAEVRAAFAGPAPAPVRDPASGRPPLHRVELPSTDPRPAGVLCALFEDGDGQAAVVLTRRSTRLRSHTGEVSFPGGRLDPGETALEAACREAHEEVGIDPASVEIIGELSPLSTVSSRSAIMAFVGVLPGPPRLVPNPAEVDRAFTVALAELVAPGTYHEEYWDRAGDVERPVHFFDIPGETVWGATARLLRELLDRVLPAPAAWSGPVPGRAGALRSPRR